VKLNRSNDFVRLDPYVVEPKNMDHTAWEQPTRSLQRFTPTKEKQTICIDDGAKLLNNQRSRHVRIQATSLRYEITLGYVTLSSNTIG